MLTVSIITRGKYGQRSIETLQKHTPFQVKTASLPEILPDFIEDPTPTVEELEEYDIFDCDLLITYSLHPDVTSEILETAARKGIRSIIIPGGAKKCDVPHASKIADKYNIYLRIEELCCTLEPCENQVIKEFTKYLGKPELETRTEKGRIKEVKVLRGAPCGSTWHAAKKITGLTTDEAPARMGLSVQQYPCRAIRGTLTGIHNSARLHKEAVEKALDKAHGDTILYDI